MKYCSQLMLYNVIYCIVGGESEELDIWSSKWSVYAMLY